MLGQHIIATGAKDFAIPLPCCHRIKSRLRFQKFKAIAGNEQRFRRHVHAVVGSPDPLQQPR